jgi:uncharacterized protein
MSWKTGTSFWFGLMFKGRKMSAIKVNGIFVLVIFVIGFIVYVRSLEDRTVFVPTKTQEGTPQDIGLPFENIFLTTSDGIKIHGWFVPALDAKTTLLYFHGNAGNITGRLPKIVLFHLMGLNVFIIEYRGYGISEGLPTEKGVYQDAMAAYDYLVGKRKVDPKTVVIYGVSLGGAVAIDLASQKPEAALIIDSSFTSAKDMAKVIFPIAPSFLIKSKFDSQVKIKTVRAPKLFIHSIDDEVVPYILGRRLFSQSLAPKSFLTIQGTHNDGYKTSQKEFSEGIVRFLKDNQLL